MMLSDPISVVETRRRAHRRQNSTPNIELGHIKKIPAVAQLQRANSNRGHRRGLSLDQPRLHIPTKHNPTLGPISQDDISVSINTNNAGFQSQYQNTSVAQPSLVQPGHDQFRHQPVFSSPLALQSQEFPLLTQQHHIPPFSPHGGLSHSPSLGFHHSPGAQSPQNGSQPFSQMNRQPTPQQLDALEQHIKSVYGHMGEVHINILPTPVPTPQKRGSMAFAEGMDLSHIPSASDLHLDPSMVSTDFSLPPQPEQTQYSSPYHSPTHSISCSPHAPAVKSFMSDMSNTSFPMNDNMMFSSATTLADVEVALLSSGNSSPAHSPRPVSIADLSLDGTIEDTGITASEIQQYISEQDPVTHRWRCLYPGCDAKTFGRRENIRSHVQTHLGDRQFRCNACGKRFVRQHDLKRHAKIHSGNKPYKCPCGGGFARQDALTRHRQRGMCIGGFPNAVRKQARRGRPRKLRPEMEERLEKAARARASSSSSNDSYVPDSPSPPAERAGIDSTRLDDLPEEHEEIDNYGLNIVNAQTAPEEKQHFSHHQHTESQPLLMHPQPHSFHHIRSHSQHTLSTSIFTPPASSPPDLDVATAHLAHSPPPSTLHFRSSPPPTSTGALRDTPPTSPLLCNSTSAASEASLVSTSAPSSVPGLDATIALPMGMGMLDDAFLTSQESSMEMDPMRLSFGGEMSAFGWNGLEKGEESGMSQIEDDEFKMWANTDAF